jgi:hypothetical protein
MNRQSRALIAIFCLLLTLPGAVHGSTSAAEGSEAELGTPNPGAIYAITTDDKLISFAPGAPQNLLSSDTITGLSFGESLVGIDFRPNGEELYALSTSSRIYTLDVDTGAATPVAASFTPALVGTSFGFDFNPVADRIRITSDSEQNLRVHPDTGMVAAVDGMLAYAAGDINFGQNPNVVGSAYTNSRPTATTTTLYDIDSDLDIVVIQNPPNNGTLTTVGPLGVNTTDLVGFDIASRTNTAYASLTPVGDTFSRLYTVNLSNGTATEIGPIGGLGQVIDIAVPINLAEGADTVGAYSSATFFLRNSNDSGPADITFVYGTGGALVPLTGDWDGDGDDTAGVFDPATSTFFLRNSNSAGNADLTFQFGVGGTGYTPIVGDWNGDGVDTIGLYDPSTGTFFLRNQNTGGVANLTFRFGVAGWRPIAGDWDGDGTDTIGAYDPASSTFFLRNTNTVGAADITFVYGVPGLTPLAGDFDNNTVDSVGVYDPATATYFLRNSNTSGAADITFIYGAPGLTPLMGDWDGQ